MPTRRLGAVLAEYGLFDIDYLSVDVEGAKPAVLGALDFDRFRITAPSVERNMLAEMTGEAVMLHECSEYAQAETLYRDVLAADDSNPGIHCKLGVSLLCSGPHHEAMRAFARAVEIKPDFDLAQERIRKEAVLF